MNKAELLERIADAGIDGLDPTDLDEEEIGNDELSDLLAELEGEGEIESTGDFDSRWRLSYSEIARRIVVAMFPGATKLNSAALDDHNLARIVAVLKAKSTPTERL